MFTRSVFTLGTILSVTCAFQASAAIILQDNFDSYADQAAFEAAWELVGEPPKPSGVLSTAQSVTPPKSIHNAGTTDNAQAMRNQRIFDETGVPDIASDNVIRFSFDFYDSNAAVAPFRHHTNLQAGTSPSVGGQLVAMGMNNNQSASASGGNYYMGRILGYDPAETPAADPGGFFKLNAPGAQLRSTGWHNLAVEISELDFRFFVDGMLSEVVPNTFTLRSYDVVRLGSGLSNNNNDAFWDNVRVETIHQTRPGVWNLDENGNWSTDSNWTGGVPNAAGAEAVLGDIITAPRTITLANPVTVGRLTLQNENAYTIAGAGPLTLDASIGSAVIDAASGSHTISSPITLADNTVIAVTPDMSSLALTGALSAAGRNVTKQGAGILTVNNLRAAGLSINGGQVIAAPNGTNSGTSALGSLSIAGTTDAWTARFDLSNNDAVVHSTPDNKAADLARLHNQVKQGFNNGAWSGLGIASTTAANNTSTDTGLAVVDNALLGYTSFSGQPVTADSILLKYTYYGDIDQNGQVDADDLTVFASNFGRTTGATQVDGDIDFNGAVNADDLTVFANNFNKGVGNPLGTAKVEAVPEPSTILLATLATLLFLLIGGRRVKGARCFPH